MSTSTKFFICELTTKICLILILFCLNQLNYAEENDKQNYDYSKIKEYQGKVLYTDYEYVGDTDSKYVYIELENGKTISIGIGGASSPKDNEIVTVYTDDDNTYEFSKDSVVIKQSGFGYMLEAVLIAVVMIAVNTTCFGWKGMLVSILIFLFAYFIIWLDL